MKNRRRKGRFIFLFTDFYWKVRGDDIDILFKIWPLQKYARFGKTLKEKTIGNIRWRKKEMKMIKRKTNREIDKMKGSEMMLLNERERDSKKKREENERVSKWLQKVREQKGKIKMEKKKTAMQRKDAYREKQK